MLVYSIRIMKLRSIKREQCCGSCRLYRLLLLLLIVNYGGFRMGTSVKCRLCFRVGTMVKCWACVLGKGNVRSVGTKRGETRWNSHVMRRTGVSSPDSGNGGTWFNPGHAWSENSGWGRSSGRKPHFTESGSRDRFFLASTGSRFWSGLYFRINRRTTALPRTWPGRHGGG